MGKSSKPDIQQVSPINKAFKPAVKLLGQELEAGLQQDPSSRAYPGQVTAPLVPEMDQVRQLLAGFDPNAGLGMQWDWLQSIGQQTGGVSSSELNAFFDKSVAAPALRAFDRDISPRIRDAFASAGGSLSSRRGTTIGEALQGLGTDLTAQRAGLQTQGLFFNAQLEEAMRNRQLQGFGLAEELRGAPLRSALGLTQAAQPFQAFEQALASEAAQKWQLQQPQYSAYINPITQLTGATNNEIIASPGDQGFSGTGALGGAMAGSMFLGPIGAIGGALLGGFG